MQAARTLVETEELKPSQRRTLAGLLAQFDRWRAMADTMPHTELAELILDESGYTTMWQNDKSPKAASRLDNLKELVRVMEEYDSLAGFLEHVSLVMDRDGGDGGDMINLMTLHSAKGLEFETVFLAGWEDGLFPHQRSLDESGSAGLEEERRLAHVGLTRAKARAKITFAQNRRTHGLWQPAIPSRFIDELPEDHVDVQEAAHQYGGHGMSRFDEEATFLTGDYGTPGWQRARSRRAGGGAPSAPPTLEGEYRLAASETGVNSTFHVGERIFHQKFGYGAVMHIDGNKLTVEFEKAGRKKVVDSFVERH
jgi:DNA helicase-2/ATP-dependent DNA helicase PcrA